MTDTHILALRALALRLLAERVREADSANRAAAVAEMAVTERKPVELPDPTTLSGKRLVGSLSIARGAVSAVLTDEQAFTAWMRANYPDEVVTVTRDQVRPGTQAAFLAHCKTAEAPVDSRTGEVIPGVEIRTGSPTPRVVPEKDDAAVALLIDAIRSDPDALYSLVGLTEIGPS